MGKFHIGEALTAFMKFTFLRQHTLHFLASLACQYLKPYNTSTCLILIYSIPKQNVDYRNKLHWAYFTGLSEKTHQSIFVHTGPYSYLQSRSDQNSYGHLF